MRRWRSARKAADRRRAKFLRRTRIVRITGGDPITCRYLGLSTRWGHRFSIECNPRPDNWARARFVGIDWGSDEDISAWMIWDGTTWKPGSECHSEPKA